MAKNSTENFSAEFKQRLHELTGQWKGLLRKNKKVLLKCPNYETCQYKCGSIGGMQYHYPRCAGACPMFKCSLCGREYESRTGLNYHNYNHHGSLGGVTTSDINKRNPRRERKEGEEEKKDYEASLTTPLPTPPPLVTNEPPDTVPLPPPTVSMETIGTSPLPLSLSTLNQTTPHILPSLLKHNAKNDSSKSVGGVKSKRGGRGNKSVGKNGSTGSNGGDVISLGGVVKGPEGTDKKIVVNIPSIEYPDKYRSYLPDWRDQLKANQSVQCPNYNSCQFQCTTVNGMKYHFVRCQKDKLPEFSCSICDRSFHCRSGLVWHLRHTHKLADLPTNQKTVEVSVSKETVNKDEAAKHSRKRKPNPSPAHSSPVPARRPRKSPRKDPSPSPTAQFYLKYLATQQKPVSYVKPEPTAWVGSPPPVPKLRPPTTATRIQSSEFVVSHVIPTDNDLRETQMFEYPEETLTQWHKWYSSDSDDNEYDYEEGEEIIDEDPAHRVRYTRDSSSSCFEESSDEDYTEFASARGKGKGRGRGRGRRKGFDSGRSYIPPTIPSLLSSGMTSDHKLVNQVKLELQTGSLPLVQATPTPPPLTKAPPTVTIKSVSSNKEAKPVKLVKPVGKNPVKPPKLISIVGGGGSSKGGNLSSATPILSIAPGNYYQVQNVPSGNFLPLQLVSPVQQGVGGYQLGTSGSGLVLLQHSGSQPQYTTLSTNVNTAQKVSVIMNPRQVTLATVSGSAPSSHGAITQLDGPKGKRKVPAGQNLDAEFEQVRKKARQSLGEESLQVIVELKEDKEREEDKGAESLISEEGVTRGGTRGSGRKRGRGRGSKKERPTTIPSEPGTSEGNDSNKPSRGRGMARGRGRGVVKATPTCTVCGETFPNQRACKTHHDTNHLPISPEATIAEKSPHWRNSIKKHKYVTCDKCGEYKGKSVTAMKYHYQRCGMDTSQRQIFTCPTCGKEYTSQPGLNYHLKYHHTEPISPPSEAPPTPDLLNSTPSSRKAADFASKKLLEMSKSTSTKVAMETDVVDVIDIDGEEEGSKGAEPWTKEEMKELKMEMTKVGVVICPKEGCDQKYSSLPGLRYHLKTRHMFPGTKYACPQCRTVLSSRKKILNHVTKKHPDYEVEDADDLIYCPNEGEEFSDDDVIEIDSLADDKGRVRPSGSGCGPKRFPPFKMFGTTSYKRVVEIMRERQLSQEVLFGEWRSKRNDFQLLQTNSELCDFTPESTTSIKYDDDGVVEETIQLFQTGSTGQVFFAGGPVWAMDWLPNQLEQEPGSAATQYLALSAYKKLLEVYPIEQLITCKGLIQIWRINGLTNERDCNPKIQYSIGICHEWGIIRDMKWCPSGTSDSFEVSLEDDYIPRLGLLAVASSDGKVRLLSVPHPASISAHSFNSPCHVIPNRIAAVLQPVPMDTDHTHFGQCLSIDWLPGCGHNRIAGGYANGSVVVWDLQTALPFLSLPSDSAHILLVPSLVLYGHNGACRSVSWIPSHSSCLFSAGQDKTLIVWDTRKPHLPLQKIERHNIQLKTIAPLVWSTVFSMEDWSTSSVSASMYMPFFLNSNPYLKSIRTPSGPVACMGYNVWEDSIACGSFTGDLVSIQINKDIYLKPRGKKWTSEQKQHYAISSRIEKLDKPVSLTSNKPSYHSYTNNTVTDNFKIVFHQNHKQEDAKEVYTHDTIPLSAVTNLSWSPHSNSHHWMVFALNCGLLKIVRTKQF